MILVYMCLLFDLGETFSDSDRCISKSELLSDVAQHVQFRFEIKSP